MTRGGVLVVAIARQVDSRGPLDSVEFVPQRRVVMRPREHQRIEAGDLPQVLDHDWVEGHTLAPLALVVVVARNRLSGLQV